MHICIEPLPGDLHPQSCSLVPPPGWPPLYNGPALRRPDASNQKAQEIGFYPELYLDASIINAFHEAAKHVVDNGTRDVLQQAVKAAVEALQRRVGDRFSIRLD
jgi:hypothetical protein